MKLKDYKNEPEKYQELKNLCANLGIVATDEMYVAEILDKTNTITSIMNAANKILAKGAANPSIGAQPDEGSLADSIAKAANKILHS